MSTIGTSGRLNWWDQVGLNGEPTFESLLAQDPELNDLRAMFAKTIRDQIEQLDQLAMKQPWGVRARARKIAATASQVMENKLVRISFEATNEAQIRNLAHEAFSAQAAATDKILFMQRRSSSLGDNGEKDELSPMVTFAALTGMLGVLLAISVRSTVIESEGET